MMNNKKVLIINGANLNLLGKREVSIYGQKSFEKYLTELRNDFEGLTIDYYQSNLEGEIVNCLQQSKADYIILNAGGYTHTSVVIRDAVLAIDTPCFEVHISNIYKREEFRHESLLSDVCKGTIIGFGLDSYRLALHYIMDKEKTEK